MNNKLIENLPNSGYIRASVRIAMHGGNATLYNSYVHCSGLTITRMYNGGPYNITHLATGYGFGNHERYRTLAQAMRMVKWLTTLDINWINDDVEKLTQSVLAAVSECELIQKYREITQD